MVLRKLNKVVSDYQTNFGYRAKYDINNSPDYNTLDDINKFVKKHSKTHGGLEKSISLIVSSLGILIGVSILSKQIMTGNVIGINNNLSITGVVVFLIGL